MNTIAKKVLLVIAMCFSILVVCQPATAQFTLSGEIRPRTEYREGYRQMPDEDDKPAAFVYQRTRLNLDYQNDRVTTHLSVQNLRSWGQDPQRAYFPALDIHQAWIEFQVNDNFAARAGRQEVRYDNERFLSRNNWILPAQKHDLLLLKYNRGSTMAHFGSAFNQSGDINRNMANFGTQYTVDNYKFMNFLWLHRPVGSIGKVSLLAMAEGNENQTNGNLFIRGTWSAYSIWNFNNFQLMVNPAFQHGRTVLDQEIAAYYFRTDLSYNVLPDLRSTLGFEYLSGNDNSNTTDQKYRIFDPTHGSGHANNGYMDYFTNFATHTRGAGLLNPFLRNRLTLGEPAHLDIVLHSFFLANNYMHRQELIDRYLGLEVDLKLSYKFNDFTTFMMGYSTMFGTESMEIIKGGSRQRWAHWGFIMVTVQPVFFRSSATGN